MSDQNTPAKNIDAALAARRAAEADTLAKDQLAATEAARVSGNLNAARNTGTGGNTQRMETEDFTVEGDAPLTLEEIRARGVSGSKTAFAEEFESLNGGSPDVIALEAFMHEFMTITVSDPTDEEDLQVISLVVNGTMQPIVRGVATEVRRKYVEALARAKETRYKQIQRDANDPASLVMVPRTVLTYPFVVERDDNPRGRAWLREILKQAA